jgi:hypothetical protein
MLSGVDNVPPYPKWPPFAVPPQGLLDGQCHQSRERVRLLS